MCACMYYNFVPSIIYCTSSQGQAFMSKPSEVIFKDFELGKTYRKKLQLTNISYSFNYCKLIGVTDNLKDFVSIEFNPPGSISAGLACYMVVTFEPKVCCYMYICHWGGGQTCCTYYYSSKA